MLATDLDEETTANLQQTAVQAYRALELRDYGRIDMRLASDGKVYVLEVNPNPWLHSTAEFAMAAKKAGRDHAALIEEIVQLALGRQRTSGRAANPTRRRLPVPDFGPSQARPAAV